MAAIYTPATMKVAINYLSNGQSCANVMHFRNSDLSVPTAADVQSLATSISNWVVAELQAQQATTCQLVNVIATDVSQEGGAQFITQPGTAEYGAQTEPAMPNNVTFVIKFGTGLSGRSYRGRFYHVGLVEGQVTGNNIATVTADLLVACFEELAATYIPEGMEHVVVSTFSGGAPRVSGVATPVISYTYTDLTIDTQRKRLS